MADGGGDRLPVNCGVQLKGDKVVLMYKMGKNITQSDISWKWVEEEDNFVAKLEAKSKRGDIKYHTSACIAAEVQSALSEPEQSMEGEFFKVKFHILKSKKKPSDMPNLAEFFDVPQ